jgi:ATP-dependent DNA helicase DinG
LERGDEFGKSCTDLRLAADFQKALSVATTGERIEFADLPEAIWTKVNASEEAPCAECSRSGTCFVHRARERFRTASHVVVCNHNLFFANLRKMVAGSESFFQRPCVIVLDEGHAAEAAAQAIYGIELSSTAGPKRLARAKRFSRLSADESYAENISKAIDTLNDLFRHLTKRAIIRNDEEATRFNIRRDYRLYQLYQEAVSAMNSIVHQLTIFSHMAGHTETRMITRSMSEINDIVKVLNHLFDEANHVSWVEEHGGHYTLHSVPKTMTEILKEDLSQIHAPIIVCSATLAPSVDGKKDFDFVKNQLGIFNAAKCKAESPFDYKKNALIYIATDLPEPAEKELFLDAAAQRIEELLKISKGRALVLFTSHYSLNYVYAKIEDRVSCPIYHQCQAGDVVEKFRSNVHSVLCGTGKFWEGISIEGESLSLAIVVKLPFPAEDPLVQAKDEDAKKRGEDPFRTVRLPLMLLKLKQGAGRLIRTTEDKGVIAILDCRAKTRRYSSEVMETLPPANVTTKLDDVKHFFAAVVGMSGYK